MNDFMISAFKEAKKAYKCGEIPVGAIIVDKNGKILAKSRNNRQNMHNVLGHAEINAIIKAEKKVKDWRLDGSTLYVTLEPCEMCEMIINESRIDNVYYLLPKINKKNSTNTKISEIQGYKFLKEEYKMLLDSFFENLRQ